MKYPQCCICKLPIIHTRVKGYLGNDASPIVPGGRCCDTCDYEIVTPARIHMNLPPQAASRQARQKQLRMMGYKIAMAMDK